MKRFPDEAGRESAVAHVEMRKKIVAEATFVKRLLTADRISKL